MGRLQVDAKIVFGGENLVAVFALFRLVTGVRRVVSSQLLGRRKLVVTLVAFVLLEVRLQMRDHVVDLVCIVAVTVVALEVHRIAAQYGVVLDPGFGRSIVVIFGVHLRKRE